LAVDPLECTDSVAYGRYNAMSVIASGPKGSLLHAPDTYMEKIAVGYQAKNVINIDASVKENIIKTAKAMRKHVKDITVIVLDRERHADLITQIREVGARVRLITDGDVAGGVATCLPDSGIDMMMGIGGSTEAVLAAVPIKILGGEIICRFKPRNNEDAKKIKKVGVTNLKKIFYVNDLAQGKQLTFTATGVIDGPLLSGVIFEENKIITHSIVIRGMTGTIRYITTHHHHYNFDEYK
jgi:fructose-1,6-bisphosphatase II